MSAVVESALATHAARRAVLSLLLAWPSRLPCTIDSIGGVSNMLLLAKMVAGSESVFSRTSAVPLMDVIKNRIRAFLLQVAVVPSNYELLPKGYVCHQFAAILAVQ